MSGEAKYPEHEKLHKVSAESQALGEFIDLGLPKLGLVLYEKVVRPCECSTCDAGKGHRDKWHTEDERATAVDGVVQITECRPTYKTVTAILAEHFGIDQDKIDAEKRQMLDELRAGSSDGGSQ